MKGLIELDVNQLNKILGKHFKAEIFVKKVDIASVKNQYHPETKYIGVGGVLTLYLEKS